MRAESAARALPECYVALHCQWPCPCGTLEPPRSTLFWYRIIGLRHALPCAECECFDQHDRLDRAVELSVGIHAAQASHSSLHADRRFSWSGSGPDGLVRVAREPGTAGVAALCDSFPLAVSAFFSHRVALPGRLCASQNVNGSRRA